MEVILSSHMGMCFGVRDAIASALSLAEPSQVTIHGEIVHNPEVIARLHDCGFAMTGEAERSGVPPTPFVLITAHGVSDRERRRLEAAGKTLVDTTCPLVRRVHQAAQELERDGYFVVVLGRRGHVEVEGITGDLQHSAVVQSVEEVRTWDHPRIGIVCQSTTTPLDAARLRTAIEQANPGREIRFVDTICSPTRSHQEAMADLLARVDALVVVGGKRSNNTRMLGRMAEQCGVPWLHVETADEIEPAWFKDRKRVGLTAGTSTPDDTIREVHEALKRIA